MFKRKKLEIKIKQLDELIDRFTEITECVSADLIKSRKLIIEYTPLENIDNTIEMIMAKIKNEILKQIPNLERIK